MNRYQTLAIFVTLMIIVLGSVNSYFLKKAKARVADQAKIEQQETRHQKQEIRREEDYLEYDEEDYAEEESEFTQQVMRQQSPDIVEKKTPSYNPRVPQARETRYYNVDEEIREQNGLKTNNLNKVSIPCLEAYKRDGLCSDKESLIADKKDSVSKIFLAASNGETDLNTHLEADISGSLMTIALAEKTCTDKGMRLPEIRELSLMFKAEKPDYGEEFADGYYWAKPFNENTVIYCRANTDECRRQEGISDPPRLYRVRCVD